jgi:hypothetical protein
MSNPSDTPENGERTPFEPQDTSVATVPDSSSPKPASRRIGFVLLATFFLTVNLAMLGGVRVDESFAGLILGTVAAEITLCAVFAALAPYSVFRRVTAGMIGAIVVCLAVYVMDTPSAEGRTVVSVAAFLQWIAVQIPLWGIRVHSGWCLRQASEGNERRDRQDLQFGIRQLLAWTAAVAVVLSLAKLTIPEGTFDRSDRGVENIMVVTLLVAFSSIATWPMIWAAFVRSRMLFWCGVATACSAILCACELWAFRTVVGVGADTEVFIAMHLIQLVAVGSGLLLVRQSGVRLVRDADHD